MADAPAHIDNNIKRRSKSSMQRVGPRMGIVLLKLMKAAPVVGYIFILSEAPVVLKRKGYVFGSIAVALDMLPVICLVKAGVEIFTGDLIPNKYETELQRNLPQNLARNLEAAA